MIMRRGFRLLLAIYIGGIFYFVTTIVWGPNGINAMDELAQYKMMLEENVVQLESINTRLNQEIENLKWADQIALNARVLGYYQDNERLLRVASIKRRGGAKSIGVLLKLPEIETTADILLRSGGIIVFLLFLLILEWGFSATRRRYPS